MTYAKLPDILRGDPRLGRLTKRAEKLAAICNALRRQLPDALARSVSVCNLRDGCLIVTAHDGSAAAKVRHLSRTLAERLHAQVPEVTAIKVKLQPSTPVNPLQDKHISIGGPAAEALHQLASRLPASDLKQALQRLGARAASASND